MIKRYVEVKRPFFCPYQKEGMGGNSVWCSLDHLDCNNQKFPEHCKLLAVKE